MIFLSAQKLTVTQDSCQEPRKPRVKSLGPLLKARKILTKNKQEQDP